MFKELLSTPTTQLGKATRFLVFQIKMWSHCARLLEKNRAGQQAAALAYHTVFGIVPLAIVMLMIFQILSPDVGRNVKQLIYEQMNLTEIKFSIKSGQPQADPNVAGTNEGQTIADPNQTEDKPDATDPNQGPNAADPNSVRADSGSDEAGQSDGPNQQEILLTEYIDDIVNKFFAGLNKGSVATGSLLIVIWAALGLLSTIERAFNQIWHVARGRGFLHRIINYWAILTLGPLLIGLGAYVSTHYTSLGDLQRKITGIPRFGPIMVSYFLATAAFFLLYFVLPNTKVKAKAAIWGALVAALVWTLAKWGFAKYVTDFIPYSTIYGLVGLVPLAVLWIFITWLIVLFGLQLTFTTQHLKTLDAAEMAAARKTEETFIANDLTAMSLVRLIAAAFQHDRAPLETEVVCSKLDIPGEFGGRLLTQLVKRGILVRTAEPTTGYIPAKDPAGIKLSEIVDAVSEIGIAQPDPQDSPALARISAARKENLAQYSLSEILDDPQLDAAMSPPTEPEAPPAGPIVSDQSDDTDPDVPSPPGQ